MSRVYQKLSAIIIPGWNGQHMRLTKMSVLPELRTITRSSINKEGDFVSHQNNMETPAAAFLMGWSWLSPLHIKSAALKLA